MDYIETITRERIRKVCENDNKSSFIYCELTKFNQGFIDQIQEAKNTAELWKIWEQMKKMAFLSYQLDPKNIDNSKSDFGELSFEDQQKFLISLLDKNLLYVPYCDIVIWRIRVIIFLRRLRNWITGFTKIRQRQFIFFDLITA